MQQKKLELIKQFSKPTIKQLLIILNFSFFEAK